MQKVNNYKGHSLFNDVKDVALRTFNRCIIMQNLNEDYGEPFAIGYGACLKEPSHKQMLAMFQYIKVKGVDTVRREITNGRHSGGAVYG